MTVLYVESSAVLSWLLGEPRGVDARELINEADTILSSVLTQLECQRALLRAEQQEFISSRDAQALRGLHRRADISWLRMEVTATVRERAARPFPVEPLRSVDAIHLATALEFAQVFPDISILSFDNHIRSNATALGIPLAPP